MLIEVSLIILLWRRSLSRSELFRTKIVDIWRHKFLFFAEVVDGFKSCRDGNVVDSI
jgi:hypothetical protein